MHFDSQLVTLAIYIGLESLQSLKLRFGYFMNEASFMKISEHHELFHNFMNETSFMKK